MFSALGILVLLSVIVSLALIIIPFLTSLEDKGDIIISRPVISGIIYLFLSALTAAGLYADIELQWPYWSWTISFWLLIPLHLGLSIEKVTLTELAVVTFLERPVKELAKSGPTWVPWLFYRVQVVPKRMQELEIPGPAAQIWRGERDNIPEDRQPAFRVLHAMADDDAFLEYLERYDNKEEGSTPLTKRIKTIKEMSPNDAMFKHRYTSEVEVFVRWQPNEAGVFLQNYGTVEEVNRLIEDTVKGAITGNLPRLTIGTFLLVLDNLNRQLIVEIASTLIGRSRLSSSLSQPEVTEEDVQNRGIDLLEVTMRSIDLDHALNKSMSMVLQSEFNRKATETAAAAERKKLEEEGEGKAKAQKLALLAEADGHKAYLLGEAEGKSALAKVMAEKGGIEAATIDALKTGLEKSQHTIIPAGDGMGSLVGIATTLQETLERNKKKRKEENEI